MPVLVSSGPWRAGFAALAAASLLAVSVPAHADVAISELARKHFTAGVNYLQDPDGARYEDAYREFKAAYAESPSWKILGNIGLTSMKLERDGEAVEAYREYLRQGGHDVEADERAQITRDLETLAAGVVSVVVQTTPGGATIVDERVPVRGDRIVNSYGVATAPLKLGLRAGHHRVTASLAGYVDQVWEFEAKPGGSESHTFTLQPPSAAPSALGAPAAAGSNGTPSPATSSASRPIPSSVFIGLAATGAFAIGATVTGLMASSKHSDFDAANDGGDPDKAKDLRDSGVTLNVVTDVLLGGAVAAAVVTSVLYFGRPTEQRTASSYTLVPVAGPRGGGATFVTRF